MGEQMQRAPHDGLDRIFDGIRGWGVRRRSRGDRWLGGVCAGVADRFGVDPVVVRAAFILLGLLAGVGVPAYLLAWSVLPDRTGVSAAEDAVRHGDPGSVVLLVVTAVAVFSGFPWWFGSHGHRGFPGGLLVLAVFVWWALRRSGGGLPRRRRGRQPTSGTPHTVTGHPATPHPATPHTGTQPSATQPDQATQPLAWSPGASAPRFAAVSPRSLPRRSGGLLMALVAIGAALLAYGVTLWFSDTRFFTGDHHVIALAVALALIGMLVTGLGVAGWRTGLVGLLAAVLAVTTLSAGAVGSLDRFGGRVGDAVWRPSVAGSGTTYRLLAGQGRLDLTGIHPRITGPAPTQPVSIGAGDLRIVVPADVTVRVDGHVQLGRITAPGDVAPPGDWGRGGGPDLYGGSDVSRAVTVGSGTPQLVVDAEVLVGQLIVTKES
jgi:phage shock protein PspC (stress-responsive transcriptional regulator)